MRFVTFFWSDPVARPLVAVIVHLSSSEGEQCLRVELTLPRVSLALFAHPSLRTETPMGCFDPGKFIFILETHAGVRVEEGSSKSEFQRQ